MLSQCKHIRTGAMLVALAGLGIASTFVTTAPKAVANADEFADLPNTLTLTGVVRDFKERSVDGGHPDFERRPGGGFGHYTRNIHEKLGEDGKPVFVGNGKKVGHSYKDSAGRKIAWTLYDASLGDSAGTYNKHNQDGGIQSADTFNQWYNDVPGVNLSQALDITLIRQPNTNVYVFDDREDAMYDGLGGFFPINDQLWGNSNGNNKNFHFTFELNTEFTYHPGEGHVFRFRGDDDVWVFINGQLVIDLGGVHGAIDQTVELDRLADILNAGGNNTLHFFFAERHRTQSNFRVETTLHLKTAELPNTSNIYD